MAGTGTSTDPYIVNSWAEFLEYNTVDYIGKYVKFPKRAIDLSIAYPQGLFTGLTIYPNIIGRTGSSIWRNLCVFGSNNTMLDFKGSVSNLIVQNVFATGVNKVFKFGGQVDMSEFGCRVVGGSTLTIFDAQSINVNDSAFYLQADASSEINLGSVELNDSNVEFYLNAPTVDTTGAIVNATRFDGKVIANTAFVAGINQGSEEYNQSLWNVLVDSEYVTLADSDYVCYFNSDRMAFTDGSSGWIGVSDTNLGNETYLESVGFSIGDDSPWAIVGGYPVNEGQEPKASIVGSFMRSATSATNTSLIEEINVPNATESIGRYGFNQARRLPNISLSDDCTYYATSFYNSTEITGGTLIE